MTKAIKKFTVYFCAMLLVMTTLCTSVFAAGTIDATVSGDIGNKNISYSYSVNSSLTTAKTGFLTTSTANSYLLTFSPASGSSATLYFYDWGTNELLDTLTVTVNGGGMPSSFITSVDLGKDKFVYVKIKSNSSTNASGWFTIERVISDFEIN